MDETANGEGSSTPSRISLANLLSPSQSPRPTSLNGSKHPASPLAQKENDQEATNGHVNGHDGSAEDVEMADASQGSRINPKRKAKTVGRSTEANGDGKVEDDDDDDDDDEDANFGEGADGEEVGDEDEDDDGDEDDEDEDDDDDEEEEDEDEDDEDDESSGSNEDVEKAAGNEQSEDGIDKADVETSGNEKAATVESGAASDGLSKVLSTEADGANGKGESKIAAKKKHMKRRSPSVEAMPAGPPPRPTVRLKLTLCTNEEDPYMTNIPDELYKVLKEKNDPWAVWYESTVPVADDNDGDGDGDAEDEDTADSEMLRSEFGDLARLLEKYPAKAAASSNGKPKGAKGAKGKKSDMDYEIGDYDVKDPFVDDSELNVDEPTYSAKPSADGFFIAFGEIELQQAERNKEIAHAHEALAAAGKRGQIPPGFGQMEGDAGGAGAMFLELGPQATDLAVVNTLLSQYAIQFGILPPRANTDTLQTPGRKSSTSNGGEKLKSSPETSAGQDGSRESPFKLKDDEDDDAERPDPPFQPIQPVKYEVERVSRRLENEFIKLRQMATKESWLIKSKFPPDLRDPLVNACRVAIASNEFNENFFNWLPQIFPYNRHTLTKYVRRQIYADHTGYMKQLMELNEQGFKRQIDDLFPRLQKEFEDASAAWQARGSREGTPAEGVKPVAAAAADEEANEGEGAVEGEEEAPVNKNAKPVKRWQWTELFRETLFTIITIDNAITALRKEKNDFEKVQEKISTINQRKDIYKRLVELWPEKGWTTTTALSNQHGLYKRKVEKFAQMLHDIVPVPG